MKRGAAEEIDLIDSDEGLDIPDYLRQERTMSLQRDFLNDVDPLIGIEIKVSRRCRCQHDLFVICPGHGAHRASLHCTRCGRRGWLSHQAAKFLSDVIEHFGRPTEPVYVRELPGATAEQVVVHTEQ